MSADNQLRGDELPAYSYGTAHVWIPDRVGNDRGLHITKLVIANCDLKRVTHGLALGKYLEVTICDLKERPWWPPLFSLRFHRARGCHVGKRVEFSSRHRGHHICGQGFCQDEGDSIRKEFARTLKELERRVAGHDEDIMALIEAIKQLIEPPTKSKKQIGFRKEK